ncbi:hypothetical protein DFH29DRAFT_1037552, partial [Suillus ampliporus]
MKTLENILVLADSNIEKGGKAERSYFHQSVLENVIFCHQEDSYWPLAEPSALKKKFDDIFEATRYTKALDSIKSLHKDRVADLKADKERLESLAKEKAHADKLRGRISDLNATVTRKQLQYEETKKQYEELVKNNAHFYESATKFHELYVKVENLQQRRNIIDRSFRMRGRACGSRSDKNNIKGYNHSPLECKKVVEFVSRLGDLQRRQRSEHEKLQTGRNSKNDEHSRKLRLLHTELESLRMKRGNAREQIKERQAAITKAESSVETMQGLASELRTLAGDIEEKKLRLEKATKARSMEDQRNTLNLELRSLSMQAESRARLDLKQAEMWTLSCATSNFGSLVGRDARAETMERDIDRLSREKDEELADAEAEAAAANKELQQAETTLSHAKSEMKSKRDEMKKLEKKLKDDIDGGIPFEQALSSAQRELNLRKTDAVSPQVGKVVQDLLKLSDETDLDILNHSMEAMVDRFQNELLPVASQLTHVCANHTCALREKAWRSRTNWLQKTSMWTPSFRTAKTIKMFISTHLKGFILSQVQEVIIPIIRFTLENKLMGDLFDNMYDLVDALTFRLHAISPNMWPVFELTYDLFKSDAVDFLDEMLPPWTTSCRMVLMLKARPDYRQKVLDMYRTALTSPQLGDNDKINGCKLAESMLLNMHGHVDD